MNRTCENCIYFENLYTNDLVGGPCHTCACVWNRNFVPKEENDSVSHPNHYQSKSGLETIDVIQAFTEDLTGVESFYTGNILKYMCRWKKKNGLKDLKKARQYLDWLIEIEDPHMTEEDVKRELNRIYGAPHEEATRIKMDTILADIKDFWNSLPESEKKRAKDLVNIEKEEKKEPPKNGRYSMGEDDCVVPWNLKPHMAPSYTYPALGEYCCCESKMRESSDPEPNRPKDIVEIVWTEFWRIFYETLREVSKEEKEKKDEE